MYIAALFTWALMAVTRAQKIMPSCLELCNSVHSVNSRPIACNCEGPVQHIDVSSSYKIGDKGIYYLPVDSTPNQSMIIPLSELNFNVQNPNKPNLGLQLYGKYADLTMLRNNNNRNKKHEQSNEDVQTTSRKPLYIDIQINKTETSATFSSEANADTIQQGNNKYLKECLDIHTVLHSRRNQTTLKLRENWGTEKLDKYDILSDSDLLKESNDKCAHLNDIVKQSINEIEQSLPTKLDGTKLHVQNSVNRHSYRKVSAFLPHKTVHIKSTSTRNFTNINNSTSRPVVINDEHISSNEQKHNISEIIGDARPIVDWFSGVDANGTETIKGNLENVTIVSVSTRPVDGASTKKNQFTTNKKKSIHKEINNGTANPIHKTSTDELTSMATDIPINPNYESTTLNDSEKNTDHDDNDFRNETSQLKVSTEVVNNTVIQKIAGTNCTSSNKCFAFTEKGFPEIEFRNIVDDISTDNLFGVDVTTTTPSMIQSNTAKSTENIIDTSVDTTTYVYETTSEVTVNVNRDNSTSKTSEPELVKSASITGSIYFNYRNQNVPARFIQDPAGHVIISIDVITLCNKLNIANNGSLLIGVMCKCVQSKTCA